MIFSHKQQNLRWMFILLLYQCSGDGKIFRLKLYKNIIWKGEGFVDMKYQSNLSMNGDFILVSPFILWKQCREISLCVVTRERRNYTQLMIFLELPLPLPLPSHCIVYCGGHGLLLLGLSLLRCDSSVSVYVGKDLSEMFRKVSPERLSVALVRDIQLS